MGPVRSHRVPVAGSGVRDRHGAVGGGLDAAGRVGWRDMTVHVRRFDNYREAHTFAETRRAMGLSVGGPKLTGKLYRVSWCEIRTEPVNLRLGTQTRSYGSTR
jgi:hypothetical protein